MKRFSTILIGLFLLYIIYYDFQIGTLPVTNKTSTAQVVASTSIDKQQTKIPSFEMTVKQGDTVLSIIEKHHGTLPVSIEQVIEDFETLNPKMDAEEIMIGKKYTFPNYNP
ncbi:LysM domain-containing protein [Metabacillus litoralis]|uniref:LysM peptidoglycan-binding domain-containing protein n=1 Tax=Metabacillus litoralis TaxID=152268 RepID=UPI000EF633AE|nr:LysM domain-containing protein [Metabacillus litoralis]MCM3161797.1 LysM peptidoglycan-binding domain-containing protein [Metabacillus litoralis]MCM3412610.1 LysM peptidoglycan-binding domain-containing protein [Metabacillus litoralis]